MIKTAEDRGFKITKLGGLFSKKTREGVSAILGHWITDGQLRLELRGRERRLAAGTGPRRAGHHGRRRETRRRTRFRVYGPRFDEPRAPGEKGGESDLAQAENAAGGHGRRGGRHGRRRESPWRTRIGP